MAWYGLVSMNLFEAINALNRTGKGKYPLLPMNGS